MGYDMYWVEVPATVAAAHAAAAVAFQDAVDARNAGTGTQAAAQAAFDHYFASQPNYFRLNIWGMAEVRQVMARAAMSYPSQPADYPDEAADEAADGDSPARARWLRSGVQERPGIAAHKLGSNDGWVVTPLECLGALGQWQTWCGAHGLSPDHTPRGADGQPIDYWAGWLAWLTASASVGGFEVW